MIRRTLCITYQYNFLVANFRVSSEVEEAGFPTTLWDYQVPDFIQERIQDWAWEWKQVLFSLKERS